jgi:hypothetical protein
MLFRTVYGPELEAVYRYVPERNVEGIQPEREDVQAAFIARQPDGDLPSTQSIDDALAFLESALMLDEASGYCVSAQASETSFAVQVLQGMRRLEMCESSPDHPLDPLYTLLLTELFIRPDRLFVADLHAEANQLRAAEEAGGLSKEKVGAWKRVMTFLGVGRRLPGGFQCAYSPSLVKSILAEWNRQEGTLQSFLEDCFALVLPYARVDGGMAQAVKAPLLHLIERGEVDLFSLQDSPTRSYFGRRRYKGIARKGNEDGNH